VKGVVPPLTVSVIFPELLPKQLTFEGVADAVKGLGSEMTKFLTPVQPLLSVIVTLYVFAVRFETSCVVALLDHIYVNGEVPPKH
jgi:hypothetical protein